MPQQPTVTEIRTNAVLAGLTRMVTLLNEVTDVFGTPFMRAISNTTLSLITSVQNVKRNKDECIRFMENICSILYVIIDLHITSEIGRSFPPAILDHIGNFTQTLHKIHTFVETQQHGNKIKNFLRQNEMNTLRKDCQEGLEEALKVFKVETGLIIANNMAEMYKKTQSMHQELLDLVGSLSDGSSSDESSPKIFHGREQQLQEIVVNLTQQSACIAILGAGGIGKTSLARAALHHPDVAAKYEHRFFIAADSATTSIELATLTGSHLGLKPGKEIIKAVLQFLSTGPSCLLVLDNLETPWEPFESRGGVEEFLSLLTGIPHLALIITMRGAERPAKVRWTRPFLEPLTPLSYDAARQTFIEIADDFHDRKDIDQLLSLTDNMPLAVDLIAHLVDYEGCSNVLSRWETEKTSLLSIGNDKQSSLDGSITVSLASPRMTSGARTLLSLLSVLPDGLSDVELVQSNIPIQDPLGCRVTLLRTSLAYFDDKQRLKSLVPIREHIQSFMPPSRSLFHQLSKYFYTVLDLYQKYNEPQLKDTISRITPNLGNLHQLLLLELHSDNPDLEDAITCTLSLNSFGRVTGYGCTTLMTHIPVFFPRPCDDQIEMKYVIEMLKALHFRPLNNPQTLIHQGMAHHFDNLVLESEFHAAVAYYYFTYENNLSAAEQSFQKALSFAKLAGDPIQQSTVLEQIAWLEFVIGSYDVAQIHAHEAQELGRRSASAYLEAAALRVEALCLHALGSLKESVILCQRARDHLQLCGMLGSQIDYAIILVLAEGHLLKSEYRETHRILIELSQKVQHDPYYKAIVLLNTADVDLMLGADVPEVQQNLDSAMTTFSTLGMNHAVNQCESLSAGLHLREGNISTAQILFQQCFNAAWGTDSAVMTYCLDRLADVGCWRSTNAKWSYQWPVTYLVHAQKAQMKLALHKALRCVGDVFLLEGDEDTAHNLFVVALEGFTYMDVHRSRADCMLRLGDIAKNGGDLVKAGELWKEARPLFERSSQDKEMAKIDTRLAFVEQEISDIHQKLFALLNRLEAPTISADEPLIASNTPNTQTEDAILENEQLFPP
ncbi:hypothetical protein C8R44DRAFT_854592 [Mycena epipterygia]|nr:hypothetical protein C8R44DRAFT_854592 [Mycena epipterygia]